MPQSESLSLLHSQTTNGMESSLNDVENGYGTSESKKEDGSNATSKTYSLSTNVASTDDESQDSDDKTNGMNSWLLLFFVNIFLACASFSIVMPSLAPYLLDIGAPLAFLPYVVASYSVGEMVGSVVIGHIYEYTSTKFETVGLGPKLTLMLCMILGVIGSALYAVAGWIENEDAAKWSLLCARVIQGLWTGGQQTVEQAYLSAAVHPSKRTEYTATLSTCAVLGFVMGPTIGALLSQIDILIFGLPVNSDNSAGVFMFAATSFMFLQTALFFDGKGDTTSSGDGSKDGSDEHDAADSSKKRLEEETPFNHMGVAMCMIIFYVHYYSFAVQETIITPMVMMTYRWEPLEINLLFTGAGLLSLVTAFSLRYLTRYVEDRTILLASIFIGFIGSVLLIDLPFNQTLPVWRFLLGFSLITIAFPMGRTVVLGIFGTVLGDMNQGRWMGIIMAVSAFPRVIGPFVSLELLTTVDWHTWLEFVICACLFGITFLATWRHMDDDLVPYVDFAKKQSKLVSCHSPMPSPMLGKRPESNQRKRMDDDQMKK